LGVDPRVAFPDTQFSIVKYTGPSCPARWPPDGRLQPARRAWRQEADWFIEPAGSHHR